MIYYRNLFINIFILAILLSCKPPEPASKIELTPLFSDHMVLQQDMNIPVWGNANPGGQVTVEIKNQKITTVAKKSGEWKVVFKPIKSVEPLQMKIYGKDTITIKDILIGEVWIGSGQSNMEMPLAGWGKVLDYEREIAEANYPEIRLFQVNKTKSLLPLKKISAPDWKICNPENIKDFSATAYFFGRELYRELNVPIGLIHSSWGGTIIEAWMSANSLKKLPGYAKKITRIDNIAKDIKDNNDTLSNDDIFNTIMHKWKKEINDKDRGLNDPAGCWSLTDIDISDWGTMQLPSLWEGHGMPDLDGIVWFRKDVEIPSSWIGKPLTLNLSPVDDIDSTYFNGVLIGSADKWDMPRSYNIPGELVKECKNNITVRIQDDGGGGGIWGDPEFLKLTLDTENSISLAGEWHYKVGLDMNELTTAALNPKNPNFPTLLSNAMIDPLIPYAIRGVIWYQGESNTGISYQYRKLFPALINDWRLRWKQGDFPFIFVQLANYYARENEPSEHSWAELREAQLMTLAEPNTGMAVAIDIGDAEDIHPKNKQEVGRRLALNALKIAYNRNVIASGPLYKSMQIENDKIRITFSHTADSLVCRDGENLKGFAISGEDHKFYWANAEIDGDDVIVWHPEVKSPVAVRYAWAANPACNLYNSANLPASPFRTDDWPGITGP